MYAEIFEKMSSGGLEVSFSICSHSEQHQFLSEQAIQDILSSVVNSFIF